MTVGQKVTTVIGTGIIEEILDDRYAVRFDGSGKVHKLLKKDVKKCEN